ncbi:MAG: hypothetical protein ACK5VB_05610 [Bacteroidota bacterium]
MNQQDFDAKIKAELEAMEVPYDPENWAVFEKKLDSSIDRSLNTFDDSVRSVLTKVETPYDSELWNTMARQLDQSAAIRKVRYFKLAEAAVILLLAIQLESYLPAASSPGQPGSVPPPVSVPQSSPMAAQKSGNLPLTASAPSDGTHHVQNLDIIDLVEAPFTPVLSVTNGEELYPSVNPPFVPTLNPVLPDNKTNEPIFYTVQTGFENKQKAQKWFIAAFAEAGTSVVRGDVASSFSGVKPGKGIIIGKDSRKWGIETGLFINRNSFTPDPMTTIYAGNPQTGFLAFNTTVADATTVTIPLRASRKITGNSALELRALAGLTAELVSEKSFSRKTIYLPPAGQSSGGPNLPSGTIPDKVQSGVFEGGNISDNLSLNAALGIRLKASLGSNYSVFLEPTASLNLAGTWSPDRERTDRFSVRAGIYTKL